MGCKIGDLIISHQIEIEDLSGKKLAIDTNNMLYQFITTIRQPDGAPLMDSKGRITSHLQGLFSRSTKFMAAGLKLCFVFDGKAPELKRAEIEKRAKVKEEARLKYEVAKDEEDTESMAKYHGRTSVLTKEMTREAIELIEALGCPVIMAPSEGEATGSYMVSQGLVDAVVTQDADALLFGAKRVIKNLSIEGKRKKAGTLAYTKVLPESIEIEENLKNLGITQDQLIVLGILVGTDFNPGGIHGIGPKKALKLIKEFGNDFDSVFKKVEWSFAFTWQEVYDVIKNMPVEKNINLEWKKVDSKRVIELLCRDHDFDEKRISDKLDSIQKDVSKGQKGLGEWF